jgi:predicted esterase
MATATRTDRAGQYLLDSLRKYLVYVPEQCVGMRRCPLIVFLHGAGRNAYSVMDWMRPVADRYGMIVLAGTSPSGEWTYLNADSSDKAEERQNAKNIDAAMKQVLRKFAIDPNKIALAGFSNGGPFASLLGGYNLDVFNRVVLMSGTIVPTVAGAAGVEPRNKAAEYFVVAGLEESGDEFLVTRIVQRDGHFVKHLIGLRPHANQTEEYDFVGHWLQESWATPNPADRRAPIVVANPLPVLTTEALTQMTTFWTSFMKEPDSIRTAARRAHLREVVVPVGNELPSVLFVNIASLAAIYPSVAADLKDAGLTSEQQDAYRVALLGAIVTGSVGRVAGTIDTTSVLGRNIAFMKAHKNEFKSLAATEIWNTP